MKPFLWDRWIIKPSFPCITFSRSLLCFCCFYFDLFLCKFSINTDSSAASRCWLTCLDGVNINILPTLSSRRRRIGNLIIPDCQHATVCCFLTAIRLPRSLAASLMEKKWTQQQQQQQIILVLGDEGQALQRGRTINRRRHAFPGCWTPGTTRRRDLHANMLIRFFSQKPLQTSHQYISICCCKIWLSCCSFHESWFKLQLQ